MAKVHITNVVVLDNPSSFFNPFQFELTFECIEELKEDLEWKMIYVGSAESEEHDQVLDTIYVGPVPEGRHIFVFQADPPDVTKIPENDAVGVTIVLLTCSYRGQEFVRVGYFINNDYADPEMRENPPPKPLFDKLIRNILATKPRVTRFKINWDDTPTNGGLTNGLTATNGNINANGNGNGIGIDDTNHDMMIMADDMGMSMGMGMGVVNLNCDEMPTTSAAAAAANAVNCMSTATAAAVSTTATTSMATTRFDASDDMAMDGAGGVSVGAGCGVDTRNGTSSCHGAVVEFESNMDDNSLAMPTENGVTALNESSNSHVMEC